MGARLGPLGGWRARRRPISSARGALVTTQRRSDAPPGALSVIAFGPPRAVAHGRPVSARARRPGAGGAVRDAQAGVPSAGWPRAQLAFKDSMVRGILQFTPSIAFRYVLHRCESRDIRCRESCVFESLSRRGRGGAPVSASRPPPPASSFGVLGATRAVGLLPRSPAAPGLAPVPRRRRPGGWVTRFAGLPLVRCCC